MLSLVIVCVCAGTSFFLALDRNYPAIPMLAAIALFVACYTIVWSSDGFQRVLQNRRLKRTLQVGYIVRMLFVMGVPISILFDLQIGALSIDISRSLNVPRPFFTVVTTVIDGLIQHVLLALLMLIIYPFTYHLKGVDETRRGFEVLPATIQHARESAVRA